MDEQARAEWATLGLLPHVGGKLFRTLMDVYGTPHDVLVAEYDDLRRVPGVGPKIAADIINAHRQVENTHKRLLKWRRAGAVLLTWHDEHYPTPLQALDDAPPLLFVRGDWTNPDLKGVAVIGTRTPSDGVARFTANLARQLVNLGHTVVSGLAKGIDHAGHRGALSAQAIAMPTVAILGNSVLRPYPSEHADLVKSILANGGVLFAEVSPDSSPSTPALVARNRLITGLSAAVIVVETGDPGGAMHAARFAKSQLRPIYTFNYPAAGNQRLIADGHHCFSPNQDGIDLLIEALSHTLNPPNA